MSEKENTPSDAFQALIGDLDVMAKAMENEAAAAAAAGADDGEGKGEGEDQPANAEQVGDDGKPMTKSLQVTLADGTVVDAEDGTELVKSLIARLDGTESVMAKALGAAVDLIKKQGERQAATDALVKSLQGKVAELSASPAPRKTVLTVHEKPAGTLAKSQPEGIGEQEFMTKAMAAMANGKITGLEVSIAETHINKGQPVPDNIIARVMS